MGRYNCTAWIKSHIFVLRDNNVSGDDKAVTMYTYDIFHDHRCWIVHSEYPSPDQTDDSITMSFWKWYLLAKQNYPARLPLANTGTQSLHFVWAEVTSHWQLGRQANGAGQDNWGHRSGPWFSIKMLSYQYRKSHCGDKTIVRSSYLHNGISYTGKMPSLYIESGPGLIFYPRLSKISANERKEFTHVMCSLLGWDFVHSQT